MIHIPALSAEPSTTQNMLNRPRYASLGFFPDVLFHGVRIDDPYVDAAATGARVRSRSLPDWRAYRRNHVGRLWYRIDRRRLRNRILDPLRRLAVRGLTLLELSVSTFAFLHIRTRPFSLRSSLPIHPFRARRGSPVGAAQRPPFGSTLYRIDGSPRPGEHIASET